MTDQSESPTDTHETASSTRFEASGSQPQESNELSYDQRADAAAEAVRQVAARLQSSTN